MGCEYVCNFFFECHCCVSVVVIVSVSVSGGL